MVQYKTDEELIKGYTTTQNFLYTIDYGPRGTPLSQAVKNVLKEIDYNTKIRTRHINTDLMEPKVNLGIVVDVSTICDILDDHPIVFESDGFNHREDIKAYYRHRDGPTYLVAEYKDETNLLVSAPPHHNRFNHYNIVK